jgi:alkanesulfonate monooxygenase SsuD/methylene tetrahydromethanopterin reductase-like flavin-dependent oxidoreductase (luciferase family)
MRSMDQKVMRFGWSALIGQGVGPDMGEQCWFRPDAYLQLLQMVEAAGVEFAVLTESIRPTLSPMMLVGALSSGTKKIGLVPELAITDYMPFKMARLLCTLNHMTRGRIGWGMDTSIARPGAYPHGPELGTSSTLRHEIADEYVDVCKQLWSSWAPGALVEDVEAGVFANSAKVQPINHVGTYFKVRGPLNMTNEPYGRPLLVQTVAGDDELHFAGKHADVAIISGADVAALGEQRSALRTYAQGQGRDPDAIRVYFSVALQIGETSGSRVTWPSHRLGGLTLAGTIYEVAASLETAFDESGCDGIVIQGSWSSVQVNLICNQIIALLRRKGRLAPRQPVAGLLENVVS